MQTEKLQAFVLSSTDYGESDRIVSLFTLEHGRITGFARGARNSRKRFGAALDMFVRLDIQVVRKDGLSSLRQADVVSVYPGIRGTLSGIAHALYACELLECTTPEGQALPRLFRLMSAYLERLDSTAAPDPDRRFFEINLLNILGYRPSLESCSRCGGNFGGGGALMQHGGELVCTLCSATGRPISEPVLRGLLSCLATSRFGGVTFGEDALKQAGMLLDESVASHTARKVKSLEFLQHAHA